MFGPEFSPDTSTEIRIRLRAQRWGLIFSGASFGLSAALRQWIGEIRCLWIETSGHGQPILQRSTETMFSVCVAGAFNLSSRLNRRLRS